eukprot:8759756-Alexandrium_andersonii.AAC.1
MHHELIIQCPAHQLPEPYLLSGLVRKPGDGLRYGPAEIPMLLPHELFSALYTNFKPYFFK